MRVLLSTYDSRGGVEPLVALATPQIRARAAAVAGTIRTDGAAMAAQLLLDAASRERLAL
jgi:vancomycin aglycone glucosyltransferase